MEKAKVLTFEESIAHGRGAVWIQTRDMFRPVEAVYYLEHAPWLRFLVTPELGPVMIYVRKSEYGETWRCFDRCPEYADGFPWEDGGRSWMLLPEEAESP